MRKVLYLALGTSLLFSSCLFTEDEKFSDSTSIRVEQINDECHRALVAAPNGWVMELYPNTGMYGAFLLHMSFTQESVTITSMDMKKTESSLYKMRSSNGSELSFDTYNSILHQFSDPGTDGVGYGGDFEFMVVSVSDRLITLRGSKTGNLVFLHRLADDQDFAGYQAASQESLNYFYEKKNQPYWTVKENGGAKYLRLTSNSKNKERIAISNDPTFPTEGLKDIAASFRPASELYLNPGVEVDGITYSEFALNENKMLVAKNNSSVVIEGMPFGSYFASLNRVVYTIPAETFSEALQQAYARLDAELKEKFPKFQLKGIGISNENSMEYALGPCLYVETSRNKSFFKFDMAFSEAGDSFTIAPAAEPKGDKNALLFIDKGIVAYQDIINALAGEYRFTIANPYTMNRVVFEKADGSLRFESVKQ